MSTRRFSIKSIITFAVIVSALMHLKDIKRGFTDAMEDNQASVNKSR